MLAMSAAQSVSAAFIVMQTSVQSMFSTLQNTPPNAGRRFVCQNIFLKSHTKSFRPPFSKGGGVEGRHPRRVPQDAKSHSVKKRRRGVKRPGGTFYGREPSPGASSPKRRRWRKKRGEDGEAVKICPCSKRGKFWEPQEDAPMRRITTHGCISFKQHVKDVYVFR